MLMQVTIKMYFQDILFVKMSGVQDMDSTS